MKEEEEDKEREKKENGVPPTHRCSLSRACGNTVGRSATRLGAPGSSHREVCVPVLRF